MSGHADGWDLVVIGGGSAGLTAARTAATLGARVALIERDRLGGECLWTGCVPSKALLHAAAEIHTARHADRYGLTAPTDPVSWDDVRRKINRAVARIEPHDSAAALTKAGVGVIRGGARFTGPRTIAVGDRSLSFRHAVLATGSTPLIPSVPGLPESRTLTTDTVWDLDELPDRLLVVGGGPVGCELSQGFARLGSRVTLVETEDRLLPTGDQAAAALLTAQLTREGVSILVRTALREVADGKARLAGDEGAPLIPCDRVLVAAGRRPRTDGLGLGDAGIQLEAGGRIRVDDRLRTTNPRIYAAGDVTGRMAFTHVAGIQAANAALDALLGLRRGIDYDAVPSVVFTDPEVAQVGLTAEQARLRHAGRVRVRTLPHEYVDRAIAEDRTDGFTTLVFAATGALVGATVVGPHAGESAVELAGAVRKGSTARDLAGTLHPYPTYADGPWNAALAELQRSLRTPRTRRLVNAVLTLRRAALR